MQSRQLPVQVQCSVLAVTDVDEEQALMSFISDRDFPHVGLAR